MRHRDFWALLVIAVTIGLAGCQSRSTDPQLSGLVKLGFELQPSDLASLVDLVTLTVVYEDGTPPKVDTLNLVNGVVTDTVELEPSQQVTIIIRAFSSPRPPNDTRVLLYIGETTLDVPTGTVTLDILLTPPPDLLMLRAGPLYQTVSAEEETVEVFVDIHNVESLFGAAFRLHYDPTILQFESAEVGPFVCGTGLDTCWAEALSPETVDEDFIPFFVTRLYDVEAEYLPPGVSGSGRLVTFTFTVLRAGTTELVISPETVALTVPDGADVERFADLILESATLDVIESQ